MPQMTKEELDALIDKRVNDGIEAKKAEIEESHKSKLRAEFQEIYDETHAEAERKGYKEEELEYTEPEDDTEEEK